ncbi:hypothetical protein JOQ06_011615, partial [Pogonophryne albipinna]
MSHSSRKKASAASDPKANSASPAKGAGAGPLSVSAARDDETAILRAIQSLREDLLKKIDDNSEMQSKELRREISQLRDELRSAVDRVSSRTKSLEDRVESLDTAANDHSDLITTLERDHKVYLKLLMVLAGLDLARGLDYCLRSHNDPGKQGTELKRGGFSHIFHSKFNTKYRGAAILI